MSSPHSISLSVRADTWGGREVLTVLMQLDMTFKNSKIMRTLTTFGKEERNGTCNDYIFFYIHNVNFFFTPESPQPNVGKKLNIMKSFTSDRHR